MVQRIETTWEKVEELVTLLNRVIGMKGEVEYFELSGASAKIEATATEFKLEIAD